jgi:lipid A 3-O-deacylase
MTRLPVGLELALVGILPGTGRAEDPAAVFARGTKILGIQGGGGVQNTIAVDTTITDVSFLNLTPRASFVPWDRFGRGWLRGAVEVGLEGWFQYYLNPDGAAAAGLKAAARYHLLEFGRMVPYLELTAGVGGTSLTVREIRSSIIFVLEAGAGISYLVSDRVAVTAGYRFHHLSNADIESPNRGINANTAILGMSFFFH